MSALEIVKSDTREKDAGKYLHNTPEYAADPHMAIKNFAEPFLDKVHIGPAKLMVATYRQPEKTAGGILKTSRYMDEDMYQGIAGLVLKLGPLTFVDDGRVKFGGFVAAPWAWVVYKPDNGRATQLHGLHCRIIEDINIDCVVDDPELLW